MLNCHELIGFMSPKLSGEILAYAFTEEKPLYKATLAAVANAKKVRPVFLERQPRVQRHQGMIEHLSKPSLEMAASNLIRTWLIKKQKPMLIDFLDALGLQHEDGVVEDLPESVSDEQLKPAVDKLLEKYPPEEVAVYLNAFNDLNEANWENLARMLKEEDRLQLGG